MQKLSNISNNYRNDIDGLRALAVLSVLLFHTQNPYFTVGYLGVDLFFVISGFLITLNILNDLKFSEFSIFKFYAKRVIRIFPALIFSLVLTLVAGTLILFPDELKNLSLHTLAGAGFFSNILLYFEVGYFDQASNLKPLLHLWSLGIEEQFYLLIPCVLLTLYKYQKRLIPFVLFGLMVSSYSYFLYDFLTHPALIFYSPLSRFWEILAGCCIASLVFFKKNVTVNIPQKIRELAFVGLISLLIFSITSHETEFENHLYLLNTYSVLSACGLIYLGGQSWLSRLILQNKVIRLIGKMSYPIYLIHWPLIVFSRYLIQADLTPFIYNWILVLTFISAFLFYKYIEQPFRMNTQISIRKKVSLLTTLLICIVFAATFIYFKNGVFSEKGSFYTKTFSTLDFANKDICSKKFGIDHQFYCGLSDTEHDPSVLLIGDSHARHYFDSISNFYSQHSESLLALGRGGCPPVLNLDRILPLEGYMDCHSIYEKAFQLIENDNQIKTIILAASFNSYFTNGLIYKNINVKFENIYETYKTALEDTLYRLEETNKKVILFKQIPPLTHSPKNCFKRDYSFVKNLNLDCSSVREDVDQKFKNYENMLSEIHLRHPKIIIFDPKQFFCGQYICKGKVDQQVLYYDESHLNQFGSDYLKKIYKENPKIFDL